MRWRPQSVNFMGIGWQADVVGVSWGSRTRQEMIVVAYSQLENGLRAGGPQALVRKPRRFRVDPQRTSAPSFIVIKYGGRRFVASREMGEIFLRHARDVIESGESELVPLRHLEGVELLLVSRLTPYSLADLDVPERLADGS